MQLIKTFLNTTVIVFVSAVLIWFGVFLGAFWTPNEEMSRAWMVWLINIAHGWRVSVSVLLVFSLFTTFAQYFSDKAEKNGGQYV